MAGDGRTVVTLIDGAVALNNALGSVELASGERIAGKCAKPKGAWGEPISEEEHLVKVRDCLRIAFDETVAEEIIAVVRRFETLDPPAVRALIRALGNFPASA